jgi:Carboxypeptidase regulatory-like domain
MRVGSLKCLFLLFVFCLGTQLLWSQNVSSGVVAGTVTDPSGAVVSGADISLTDAATGASRTAKTNNAGQYVFVDVPPSTYNITIVKQGFATTKAPNLQVLVGQATTFNTALQVGGQAVEVEVTAAGTELQTMNATVGNTITGVSLDSLPSLNRDVNTFLTLQPAASPDGSIGGAVVDQSTFMLDGGNNTNDMDGSMSVYTTTFAGDPTGGVANQSNAVAAGPTGVMPTPADSVEEFKVATNNQNADFNNSAGAQVQIVTRRGTNSWHGSGYEYYLDNNFSANTWENNHTGVAKPDWHRSRFGARIGGPLINKDILGGKTYFFANYEGYRWPDSTSIERIVPSAAMRLGLLTFSGITYNLNATAVTYNGVTYPGNANCTPANGFASGVCDPRGKGINPLVQQLWTKYMPAANEISGCGQSRCDGVNIQGFRANMEIPQNSNFGVARVDHDFGSKWHFTSSYRYFSLTDATTDQFDIGGFFPGDTLGVPSSRSTAPQKPWYLVAGMTTNITSNFTNDFHYSFLRNYWSWGRAGDVIQFAGLGGALEPLGESHLQVLAPYNVNTQQTRTRFWDGHDNMLRDDLSLLKGSHLFQFGGQYQRNWNYHERTDNGGGINYQPVYQLATTSSGGIDLSGFTATNAPSKDWGRDYAATLGIVSVAQQAYTRSGPNLALNPPLTPAFDQVTIPFYNVYFSDTWHMKPTFTLTYGLGWTLEMPPVEANGKQIEFVDQANQVISAESYLHTRERLALQGQAYNPIVGFTLVGNSENGRKYPYDPFYGSFSPRIAAAWNPQFDSDSVAGKIFGHNDSVLRVGYGRVYGRLNGVDLVLVPLLGTGLIQPVQCFGATIALGCAGSTGANPINAFRVGIDGLKAPIPAAAPTLPQPLFPGVNGVAAGAGEALDPHFRPNSVDSFDLTLQRQLARKVTVEIGYIGRLIHNEYQPINLNSVPYMITAGGQQFQKAYANTVLQYCGGVAGLAGGGCAGNAGAVTPQPFFESSLKRSGYCGGFANCTQAVVANEGASGTGNLTFANVWSLYSDLDPFYSFGRTMMNTALNCPTGTEIGCSGQLTSGVGYNASIGHGNYNGGFVSVKMSDWRGLTAQSNFTYSKDLSTQAVVQATSEDTAVDPYNLDRGYGLAGFNRKFVYNLFMVYRPPYYTGQHGVIGHVLGGWTFAPVFTAGTGLPMTLGTINGGGQAFGEGDSVNFFGNGNSENAIIMGHIPNTSAHYNVAGDPVSGIGTSGFGLNLWSNPAAVYNSIRQPILGYDTKDGGFGVISGLNYWNMDFSIRKDINITERVQLELQTVFANIFNHAQFFDPAGDYLDTSSPSSFGTLPGQTLSSTVFVSPRTMEYGVRLNF